MINDIFVLQYVSVRLVLKMLRLDGLRICTVHCPLKTQGDLNISFVSFYVHTYAHIKYIVLVCMMKVILTQHFIVRRIVSC